jgi:KDO2-lipid IV(A) lauroyltransferase
VPKIRSAFRNRAEEVAFDLFRRLVPSSSADRAEARGRRLGRVLSAVLRSRRALAERNLAHAFPEKTAAEVEALTAAVFEHFAGVVAELLFALEEPAEALLARIRVEGVENARRAAASGRGFFFLTAHLGNWEYAALATAGAGFPMAVIGRPLDNPALEGRLQALREKTGNAVVHKADAAKELLRIMRRGGHVGILIDQHANPPQNVVVPFFGRPASTTSIVARLAERTGALVVPTSCVRVGPARYQLTYHPVLDIRELPEKERAVEPFTARLNRILEDMIREHPDQWLWLHNRWRLDEPRSTPGS